MRKDVIPSDKGKDTGSVHDFLDYQFASEVVKTHPKIIQTYEKLLPVLYQYATYQCVWPTIQMVEDGKLLAEMQLKYYGNIHKNKGKITNVKTKK